MKGLKNMEAATMRELTISEVNLISGGNNVEICQAGSALAGGVVGGVIGAYSTLGFGTGAGAAWGFSVGGWMGTLGCSHFFAQ